MSVDISTWHREVIQYVHKSFFIIKKLKNLGILISFFMSNTIQIYKEILIIAGEYLIVKLIVKIGR